MNLENYDEVVQSFERDIQLKNNIIAFLLQILNKLAFTDAKLDLARFEKEGFVIYREDVQFLKIPERTVKVYSVRDSEKLLVKVEERK